jgi:hypothetical protein
VTRLPARAADLPLRLIAAVLLLYAAWVHWDLHEGYDIEFYSTDLMSVGDLFVAEAIGMVVAAVVVVAVGGRIGWGVAFVVGFGALLAVVMTRYVDLGESIGPFPYAYETAWTPEARWSAIAEGAVALLAAIRLAALLRRRPVRTGRR